MTIADILKLLGGVALLIYGIKTMGDALQDLAGDKLRRLIGSLTGTPLRGVAVGAVVTMIIQSSSATTVMVVSFVHVGLMNLAQGFGVIMGANIGTTITAQLIAFSIQEYAIVGAIVGAFMSVVGKSRRQKRLGSGLVGFALLFVGMAMMQEAMGFLRGRQDLFMIVNDHPWAGLIAGLLVTMLVQASSATVGLTMVMASQGLLTLPSAAAIIFGDNIGTTITAVLASLGGNRAAKQAAAAHVMFNVIGTCIMMIFLTQYCALVSLTADEPARQVANAHSLFNILNTCIFLPFVKPYTAFIKRLVPDKKGSLPPRQGARFLDRNLIDAAPAAGVEAVRKEMVELGGIALGMLEECRKVIIDGDTKLIPDILLVEKTVNELTHAIIHYATELGQKGLSPDLSLLLNSCVSGVGDIERMGDHAENLMEMMQFLLDRKQTFSQKAVAECGEMFSLVTQAVSKSVRAIETEDITLAEETLALEQKIDQMERVLRARHIERLNTGKCSPSAGVIFIDILSNLERVGDHAHNLACIVSDIERIHRRQTGARKAC